ncbi:hypothetical protein OKW96_08875 [Sphingobacterium sp. KU25419]|nr:hypothetical protein OKW96_08875 [Sphingobacterium sp. KU25419]
MSIDNKEVFSIGRAYSASSGFYDCMCYLKDTTDSGSGIGLVIDINKPNRSNTAIDIINGAIKIQGKYCYSGTITLQNQKMVFNNGLLVEVTT